MKNRVLSSRIDELMDVQLPDMYNLLRWLFAAAGQQDDVLAGTTRASRILEYVACLLHGAAVPKEEVSQLRFGS